MTLPSAYDYVRNIKNAQLTIHDPIQVGDKPTIQVIE